MISPIVERESAPILRQVFTLDTGHGAVTAARLHISSLGIFEASINGTAVSTDVLSPGWSSYEWRLRYRSYDVLELLGDTFVLGISLGNGWYRGRLGWDGRRALYGERLGAIAQLEIEFDDGHRQTIVTDDSWQAGPSATLSNDLYDGQTIDARLRDDSWAQPYARLSEAWTGVEGLPFDTALLTPYIGPPVVRHEEIAPAAVLTAPSGRTIVDFGQNLVGWTRITVSGIAGTKITVRHAEVLEHGELGVRPLRTAAATDRFILSGGLDLFEPTMTFHGFRYVDIDGWPGEFDPAAIKAVVVHSDIARTGVFECSEALINQLHRNVVWGLRGNFLDVPTDCPQRDERLGWTGDLAVFAPTAAFLYDVGSFLSDWLADLAAEQAAQAGLVPLVVPDILKSIDHPLRTMLDATAIWGDAAVWVPWALWEAYGDRDALADHYPSMAAHVRRAVSAGVSERGLWERTFQLGDWLDPDAPPDQPWKAKADHRVVATACLYRDATILCRSAELLGRVDDTVEFAALAARTRTAFNQHYVMADGMIKSDAATAYTLAIAFDLLDPNTRQKAGDRLAALVRAAGHHISTGFAGTPYICDALTTTGHLDDAYRLLLETTCPSWLYAVTMGATTVWERWDSMLPDGSINPGEMTSFNHYALGAIADWLHRTVAGMAPLEPGYRRVLIAPRPAGGLSWAKAGLETDSGRVAVEWRVEDQTLTVVATLPPGVTGVVDLPGRPLEDIPSGTTVVTGAAAT